MNAEVSPDNNFAKLSVAKKFDKSENARVLSSSKAGCSLGLDALINAIITNSSVSVLCSPASLRSRNRVYHHC